MESTQFSTMFERFPIGAYCSSPDGRMLRANAALVRLNGYESEAELLTFFNDVASQWYVDPGRRVQFLQQIERDGHVLAFVSEVYRHKTRERIWVSEHAHVVRAADGTVLCYEGTVEDITDSRTTRLALQHSEALLREVTSQVPGLVYRVLHEADGSLRYTFVSEGVHQLYGVAPQEVLADGGVLRRLWHPEDRSRVLQRVAQAVAQRAHLSLEFRIQGADGTTKWVELTSSAAADSSEGSVRVGVVVDITARKQAELALQQTEARWKLALESTGDGMWDWHIERGEEFYSESFMALYGLSSESSVLAPHWMDERTHPDDLAQVWRDREAHFSGQTPSYRNEHRVRCADGSWKWIMTRGMVIERDLQGRPVRMIGTHTDISERKSAEARIWHQAHYDSLTGLPNRLMLGERLDEALARAPHGARALALLFMDLDHFKEVNDTLGHGAGDLLLQQVAQRLQACVGAQDTVARMGGDEFTLLLLDAESRPLQAILQDLLNCVASSFDLDEEQVMVSASIGVAYYPQDAGNAQDLRKHADLALYAAKGAGRNQYQFFTPALRKRAWRGPVRV